MAAGRRDHILCTGGGTREGGRREGGEEGRKEKTSDLKEVHLVLAVLLLSHRSLPHYEKV